MGVNEDRADETGTPRFQGSPSIHVTPVPGAAQSQQAGKGDLIHTHTNEVLPGQGSHKP